MPAGKLRCYPSISETVRECTPYRVDFLGLTAIVAAVGAAGWLMFSFLETIQSATQISDLLLPADVLIFAVMFLIGLTVLIIAWILGGVSFGISLGDVKDFFHTIFWSLIYAMVLGIAVLPTLFLSSSTLGFMGNDMRMVVALVLLAPVGEETLATSMYSIINAYFPSDGLGAFMGKAFIPSIMFSIGHFWAIPLTAANFAFTFTAGYILNFSYWHTKKVGVRMGAHWGWNLYQLFAQGMI